MLCMSVQALSLSAAEIVLENHAIKAVFNDKNGALEQMVSKESGWQIQQRLHGMNLSGVRL